MWVQLKATFYRRPYILLECSMAVAGQSYCQPVGVTVMICDEAMRLARSLMDKAIICKLSPGGKRPQRCNWKLFLFFFSAPVENLDSVDFAVSSRRSKFRHFATIAWMSILLSGRPPNSLTVWFYSNLLGPFLSLGSRSRPMCGLRR